MHFNRECVQCRAFNKGEKKDTCAQECSHFNITKVENRDRLPQPGQVDPLSHCKEKDVDDCWFYFTYSVNGNNEATVHVVETPGRNLIISKFFAFSFMSLYCLGLLVVSLISRNNSSWTIICPSWDTFNLSKLKLVFN